MLLVNETTVLLLMHSWQVPLRTVAIKQMGTSGKRRFLTKLKLKLIALIQEKFWRLYSFINSPTWSLFYSCIFKSLMGQFLLSHTFWWLFLRTRFICRECWIIVRFIMIMIKLLLLLLLLLLLSKLLLTNYIENNSVYIGTQKYGISLQVLTGHLGYLKHRRRVIIIFHMWWFSFLSGWNPYKALQFV